MIRLIAAIIAALLLSAPAFAADAAFQQFLQSTWPAAQALGVSRSVFDSATRNLEPDLSLPDHVIPGRPEKTPPGQAEFVQTPGQYLREPTFDRVATRGKQLAAQYRDKIGRASCRE